MQRFLINKNKWVTSAWPEGKELEKLRINFGDVSRGKKPENQLGEKFCIWLKKIFI